MRPLRGLGCAARWSVVLPAALAVWVGVCVHAHAAAVLPPGFVETDVATYAGPVGLAFSPDGAMWVAISGPGEGMHVWSHGNSLALTLDGFPTGERGLHAIAVDPDYLTNGGIWVYYTVLTEPIHNRLSRFSNRAIVDPGAGPEHILVNEQIVWDGPTLNGNIHNGGCLAIGTDGVLYVGTGEDLLGSVVAQDTFDHRGKILRMQRDGSPVPGNPFDGTDGDPLVWAMGLRNPFRCALQPGTDNLFVGDVGGAGFEEVNLGFAGANFGWAVVEGETPSGIAGMTYPLIAYPHDDPRGAAVIVGAHARPGDFDVVHEGDLFNADWARGTISRVRLDAGNNVLSREEWAVNAGFPVDLTFGPDGALYYASRGINRVRRVEYVGGANRQPVAEATATPSSGTAPLTVFLDGRDSFDPDDDVLTHTWLLGDGEGRIGETAIHTYDMGVYGVSLTVDDGQGLNAIAPPVRVVAGNRRPLPSISAPLNGQTYNAGDVFSYGGSATDTEDGPLDCANYSWQIVFRHDDHTHPFIGPLQGECGGSFTVPTLGETSANVWFAVHLRATDSGSPIGPDAALTGHRIVEIFPNTAVMSFETTPTPDLTLELDTAPFAAPASVQGVVGLQRRIGAPSQQRDGHTYTFDGWSDGGAESHDIATPTVDTTYTASFVCDVIVPVANLLLDLNDGYPLLTWDSAEDPCLTEEPGVAKYRVFTSPTAVPLEGEGSFPSDPFFAWAWSTNLLTWEDRDSVEPLVYYLVGATGSDGLNGRVGHYGQ